MTTETQIMANRANALKSTGPKSSDGKGVASQNAFKHGLLSKDLLVQDEKRKDIENFRNQIYSTLAPHGAIEELLVEKIINAAWRLQRLMRIEVSIFEKKDYYSGTVELSDLFCGTNGSTFQSLSRYESTLERNFYKAIHELQRVQAMRMGSPAMAPIAIDITGLPNE